MKNGDLTFRMAEKKDNGKMRETKKKNDLRKGTEALAGLRFFADEIN